MHFRMFEIARDHFHLTGTHDVVGGIISPVHEAYGKDGLIQGIHRYAMVKLGLQTSDWIRCSDWELQQNGWSRTRQVLSYHQNYLNNYLKDLNGMNTDTDILPGWVPPNIKHKKVDVQVKLLCGADLLESFSVPGLWKDEDVRILWHSLLSLKIPSLIFISNSWNTLLANMD